MIHIKRCGFMTSASRSIPAIDTRLLPQAFVQGDHPQEAHYVRPTLNHAPVVIHKTAPAWKRASLKGNA